MPSHLLYVYHFFFQSLMYFNTSVSNIFKHFKSKIFLFKYFLNRFFRIKQIWSDQVWNYAANQKNKKKKKSFQHNVLVTSRRQVKY